MNKNELIRLRQFNQLKKDMRGSKEHLIIGIDIGKDKHHAFKGGRECSTGHSAAALFCGRLN